MIIRLMRRCAPSSLRRFVLRAEKVNKSLDFFVSGLTLWTSAARRDAVTPIGGFVMKHFQSRFGLYVTLFAATLGLSSAAQCSVMDYLRMLNPRVLKQLDTDMVRLVNELPNL